MPTKIDQQGQQYAIDGKTFVWKSEESDVEIRIPMRFKMKVMRSLSGRDLDNLDTMFDLLDAIAPGQADVIDELDVNEFQQMFSAWQSEYTALNGASLGEAPGSSV